MIDSRDAIHCSDKRMLTFDFDLDYVFVLSHRLHKIITFVYYIEYVLFDLISVSVVVN